MVELDPFDVILGPSHQIEGLLRLNRKLAGATGTVVSGRRAPERVCFFKRCSKVVRARAFRDRFENVVCQQVAQCVIG